MSYPYCCVQTPFEEYRGQLVQYCTQNALIYPQTSGLVTATTGPYVRVATPTHVGNIANVWLPYMGNAITLIQRHESKFFHVKLLVLMLAGIKIMSSSAPNPPINSIV